MNTCMPKVAECSWDPGQLLCLGWRRTHASARVSSAPRDRHKRSSEPTDTMTRTTVHFDAWPRATVHTLATNSPTTRVRVHTCAHLPIHLVHGSAAGALITGSHVERVSRLGFDIFGNLSQNISDQGREPQGDWNCLRITGRVPIHFR